MFAPRAKRAPKIEGLIENEADLGIDLFTADSVVHEARPPLGGGAVPGRKQRVDLLGVAFANGHEDVHVGSGAARDALRMAAEGEEAVWFELRRWPPAGSAGFPTSDKSRLYFWAAPAGHS